MKNKSRYWKTRFLHLAAFVFAKGGELVSVTIERGNPSFCFARTNESAAALDDFHCGRPLVDIRFYIYALRLLDQRVNEAFEEFHGQG